MLRLNNLDRLSGVSTADSEQIHAGWVSSYSLLLVLEVIIVISFICLFRVFIPICSDHCIKIGKWKVSFQFVFYIAIFPVYWFFLLLLFFFDVVSSSYCILFMLCFYNTALILFCTFPYSTVSCLLSFHVVLFSSCALWWCNFFMLYTCIIYFLHVAVFYIALFSCCALFTLHFFLDAFFSCCTLFKLHYFPVELVTSIIFYYDNPLLHIIREHCWDICKIKLLYRNYSSCDWSTLYFLLTDITNVL